MNALIGSGLRAVSTLLASCAGVGLLVGATMLVPRGERPSSATPPGLLAMATANAETPSFDCTGARDQLLAYRAAGATASLGATLGTALRGEQRSYPARAIRWDALPGAGGLCDVRMTRGLGNDSQTLHWQVTTRLNAPITVEAQDTLTRRLSGW